MGSNNFHDALYFGTFGVGEYPQLGRQAQDRGSIRSRVINLAGLTPQKQWRVGNCTWSTSVQAGQPGASGLTPLPFPCLNSLLYFYNLFASGTLPLIKVEFSGYIQFEWSLRFKA